MAIYYVDTNSAAGGDGTTQLLTGATCAWDTIADVNGAAFAAGDSVLFRAGCTWREQLTVPSSGSTGLPITFGAYGSGEGPTIDGKYIPALTWTPATGTETVANFAAAGDDNYDEGQGFRLLIPETKFANNFTSIRINVAASTVHAYTLTAAYIGQQAVAGDSYDMEPGTIAQFLFSGGAGVTVTANTTVWSDWLTYTGDGTKGYILSRGIGASPNGQPRYYTATGFAEYHKTAGAGEAATADVTGYGAIANQSFGIQGVETQYGTANVYQAPLTASAVNYVLFNGVTGTKQAGSASCIAWGDWYFASNILYVYATSAPTSYYTSIAPVILQTGINLNSKNYIRVTGFRVRNYDAIGVNANSTTATQIDYCIIDGNVPYQTGNYGVSLNGATSALIYNNDILRNYYGIYNTGGSGNLAKNNQIFGNREYGIYDAGNTITYNYNAFAANAPAKYSSIDTVRNYTGGTDGGNNIETGILGITVYQAYPAIFAFDYDDLGLSGSGVATVNSQLSLFTSRSLKASMDVVTDFMDASEITSMQAWATAGHDIFSGTFSHWYYTNLGAFHIQYVGAGSACTMTITGNTLATTVTGGPGGEALSIDLTAATYDTVSELQAYIDGLAAYTASADYDFGHVKSKGLADVTAQDIRAATYATLMDKTRALTNEAVDSKAWIDARIATPVTSLMTPGGISDATLRAIYAANGYLGITNEEPDFSRSGEGGINVYDLWVINLANFNASSQATIQNKVAEFALFSGLWGQPIIFVTDGGFGDSQVTYLLDACVQYGIVSTVTAIITSLRTGTAGATYYYKRPQTGTPDFHLQPSSPAINAGVDVGLTQDYEGRPVPSGSGVDIGVYEYSGNLVIPTIGGTRGSISSIPNFGVNLL